MNTFQVSDNVCNFQIQNKMLSKAFHWLLDVNRKHICFLTILSMYSLQLYTYKLTAQSWFPSVLLPATFLLFLSVGYMNEADIIAHVAGIFFFPICPQMLPSCYSVYLDTN